MILELLDGVGDVANSPFIVPVAGCAMIACIVAVTSFAGTRKRQIESEERLAAIARGVPVPPTLEEVSLTRNQPTPNALRRRGNIRLASAVAIALFFITLWIVIGERQILAGVACALIPAGIGAGLLIDAKIQTRELEASGDKLPTA
jgi:uncharacterized membrane protein (GlpM family)